MKTELEKSIIRSREATRKMNRSELESYSEKLDETIKKLREVCEKQAELLEECRKEVEKEIGYLENIGLSHLNNILLTYSLKLN
jgi:flagellar motility protein MotE (MotC chaperone)